MQSCVFSGTVRFGFIMKIKPLHTPVTNLGKKYSIKRDKTEERVESQSQMG